MTRAASRTAVMVATYRGRATNRTPALCHDPHALALAGEDGPRYADAYEKAVPHIELWVALRTARIDEAVSHALDEGIRQVVILGAGLDARAARLARAGVRFFEVDMPSSQEDKKARVAELAGYPVDAATYVPCDFEHDDFLDRLVANGFRADEPAFFVWEGVSYYLTEAAVRATLSRVASGTHPGSTIVFDTFGKRFVRGEVKDGSDLVARDRVAEMGEPMYFGIDDHVPFLYELGFRKAHVETFDEIALNLTGTYDRARKFRFQCLVFASRERRLS